MPSKYKKKKAELAKSSASSLAPAKYVKKADRKAVSQSIIELPQVKRPRGRPPLVANKAKLTVKQVIAVNRPSTAAALASQNATGRATNKQIQPKLSYGKAFGKIAEPKTSRLSSTDVTKRVLAVLMTSEPMSLADLCAQIPDATRDIIYSVLECLLVLGIVIELKMNASSLAACNNKTAAPLVAPALLGGASTMSAALSAIHAARSSSDSNTSNGLYYALADCAKVPVAIDLSQIVSDVKEKLALKQSVDCRIEKLQELSTNEDLTTEQRKAALKNLVGNILIAEPALWDDPLYATIAERTGCNFESTVPDVMLGSKSNDVNNDEFIDSSTVPLLELVGDENGVPLGVDDLFSYEEVAREEVEGSDGISAVDFALGGDAQSAPVHMDMVDDCKHPDSSTVAEQSLDDVAL